MISFFRGGDLVDVQPRFTADKKTTVTKSEPKEKKELPEGVIKTTWGPRKKVLVIFRHIPGIRTFSWELWDGGPVDSDDDIGLHWADLEVISRYALIEENYLIVKPYVLSATLTNQEIADAEGKSLSWVEKLVPRIKEARDLYNFNPSPI